MQQTPSATNDSRQILIPEKPIRRGQKLIDRTLGFAFVEFQTAAEAERAIERFDGSEVRGRTIYVKHALPPPTQEEKEKKIEAYRAKKAEQAKARREKKAQAKAGAAASTESTGAGESEPAPDPKVPKGTPSEDTIFITNLHFKVRPPVLAAKFQELSPKWVHIPTSQKVLPDGKKVLRSKGFAFVKFNSSEAQRQAVEKYNGLEINGRKIVVDVAIDTRDPKKKEQVSEPNTEGASEAATEAASEAAAEAAAEEAATEAEAQVEAETEAKEEVEEEKEVAEELEEQKEGAST